MDFKDTNTKMAFVCVAVSLVGLVIMLASNTFGDVKQIQIAGITKEMAGERGVICGQVRSISDNGKDTVFIKLADGNSTISTVFFSDVKERVSGVVKGARICIEGNIQVYQGAPELIGRKLVDSSAE